jgi:hypothetical protein
LQGTLCDECLLQRVQAFSVTEGLHSFNARSNEIDRQQ